MGFFLYQKRYWVLAGLFLAHCFAGWPGILLPDSLGQYAEAMKGIYTDHHPPMMAFIWRYLDRLIPSPGSMFLLHTTLLYGAMCFLLKTLERSCISQSHPSSIFLIFTLPLIPQVGLWSVGICKDVSFVYSFLMAGSILAYATFSDRSISWYALAGVAILLGYGISVKYQGQFCAVALFSWLGCLLARPHSKGKAILKTAVMALVVYGSVSLIHRTLVPISRASHSWQYVKLYDLAAISIQTNQDLIPDAYKTPFYSFPKLVESFQPDAVDSYVFRPNSILQKSFDINNHAILLDAWKRGVKEHPLIYLSHRARNISFALLHPTKWETFFKPFILKHWPLIAREGSFSIWTLNALAMLFLSQTPFFLLGIIYFGFAFRYRFISPYAQVLLGFTSCGFLMVGLIFFLSMAGTPRYTYMLPVMVQASHIFALGLYWDLKKRKKRLTSKSA